MSMHFKLIAASVAITLGIWVGIPPRDVLAATETNRSSSAKGKPGVARAARQQPQSEAPPIGYCMKCLPPPYAWPRGGPG